LLILGLLTPALSLAQTTTDEMGNLGFKILERLPGAIKDVWQNQALPIWQNTWAWTKGFWDSTLGSKVRSLGQKIWGLTGQETPDVKTEFQKEKKEMQNDLWERFKGLF